MCGKEISPGEVPVYVVKIEIYPRKNADALSDEDLDEDHLEAVSELLKAQQSDPGLPAPARECHRYDLCEDCRAKYSADPLNRCSAAQLEFSAN
jgi:hypothetical protein